MSEMPRLVGQIVFVRNRRGTDEVTPLICVDQDPMFLNVIAVNGGLGSLLRNVPLEGQNGYELLGHCESDETIGSIIATIERCLDNSLLKLTPLGRSELETSRRVLINLLENKRAQEAREKATVVEQWAAKRAAERAFAETPKTFSEQPFQVVGGTPREQVKDEEGDEGAVTITFMVEHPDPELVKRVSAMIRRKLAE